MAVYEGAAFGRETVSVAGNRYVRCTFRHTALEYDGGAGPIFDDCDFISVNWGFVGPAGNTVQFIRMLAGSGLADDLVDRLFRRGD